ncbi:hypothetical protein D3C80_1741190 [compost metagenome]
MLRDADEAFLLEQPEQELDHLHTLNQRPKVLLLVSRRVGPSDQHHYLNALVPDLGAEPRLEVARDVPRDVGGKAEQIEGDLVNVQIRVHGHRQTFQKAPAA